MTTSILEHDGYQCAGWLTIIPCVRPLVTVLQERPPVAGLCMLPMQDADAAIEALDRAVELDLRGVLL